MTNKQTKASGAAQAPAPDSGAPVGLQAAASKPSGGEYVQLTKAQLDAILGEIDSLKRERSGHKPKRVTEHVATLRMHEGKAVEWYGNVREVFNPQIAKHEALMDIKLYGSDEVVTVKYLDFLNSDNSVRVLIKDQKAKRVVESGGQFVTENPNPHFEKKFTPRESEYEVESFIYEATVEVQSGPLAGQVLVLPAEALNR